MRLRVMSPYNPEAGAGNLEQIGEVARVQRRNEGYGVAVALLTSVQLTAVHGQAPEATSTLPSISRSQRERRIAARSLFVAPAEIVDMHEGSRIKARTSDLSMQGCYIDTLNPFPIGAVVRVQILRHEQVLDVIATVSARHVAAGGAALPSLHPRGGDRDTTYAVRLILALVHKGILSQAEASEILSESDD